jgi:RNA polymerase-binding transcription factor DksA
MSDDIDRAQDTEQLLRQHALNAHAQRQPKQGKAECDCGEAISPLRQSLGAERCMFCQSHYERMPR